MKRISTTIGDSAFHTSAKELRKVKEKCENCDKEDAWTEKSRCARKSKRIRNK